MKVFFQNKSCVTSALLREFNEHEILHKYEQMLLLTVFVCFRMQQRNWPFF